ncbi:MAG: nucleotidyltransferase domain-containing protein [Bacillota bacterium]
MGVSFATIAEQLRIPRPELGRKALKTFLEAELRSVDERIMALVARYGGEAGSGAGRVNRPTFGGGTSGVGGDLIEREGLEGRRERLLELHRAAAARPRSRNMVPRVAGVTGGREMSRTLESVGLSAAERQAILELKRELRSRFPQVKKLILFGSAARGNAGPESDVDLLLLTDRTLPTSVKHEIYDLVFDINLRYGASLSVVCVGEDQAVPGSPGRRLPAPGEL